MRSLILGAAALIAVAAPGIAMAQTTGYVDAGYAHTSVDAGGGDNDADGWSAGGVVAFDAYALGIQLDASYSSLDADAGGNLDEYNVGGHVFTRNDQYLFGGFASLGNVDAGGGDDSDYWTVGLEGQYYIDRTTLGAALSYTDADDADVTATQLNVNAAYFITDNFSVGGDVGFASIDPGFGDSADAWSAGVNAEYQFATVPVSVFGGYEHANVDDADVDSDTLSIGVRYNFGGQTLFDRNRNGASLKRGGIGSFLGLL